MESKEENAEVKLIQFRKGWKLLETFVDQKPKGFKEHFWYFWGYDIWYNSYPVVKILVLANIIVWIIGWFLLTK